MLSQLTPKERFGYLALSAFLLFGIGYAGSKYLARPAPIVIEQKSSASDQRAPSGDAAAEIQRAKIIVHVAGAVRNPGLLKLEGDVRVQDAIDKAGGPVDADLDALNLAAKVEDGTQIYVPKKNAPEQQARVAESYRGGPAAKSAFAASAMSTKPSQAAKPEPGSISLNTASMADLDRLPGVGPATASKILEYRKAHGGFTSIDEVLAVKGIGPKKLAAMREYLRL